MSRNHDPVTEADHRRWFNRAIDDPVNIMFMGMLGPHKIGLVRFNHVEDVWEVSINVNPAGRGKGQGSREGQG